MSPWPETTITLASGSSASSVRERRQPLLGIVGTRREPEIEQRHRGTVGGERRHRSGAVLGHDHLVILGERPLHLRADVLVVLHDEQRGFRHFSSLTGKLTRNVVPLPDFAFDVHAAAVRLDDRPGLKQADAEPLLLGALKRTKQRLLQERLAHAAAVVRDRQNDAASAMLRAHLNPASRAQRVSRVEHQVGHDALDLFAVGENRWAAAEAPSSVPRSASR